MERNKTRFIRGIRRLNREGGKKNNCMDEFLRKNLHKSFYKYHHSSHWSPRVSGLVAGLFSDFAVALTKRCE